MSEDHREHSQRSDQQRRTANSSSTSPDRFTRFEKLREVVPQEAITRSHVADHTVASGQRIALITLVSDREGHPATLGPAGMIELGRTVEAQLARAKADDIQALAITGTGRTFAAGADLTSIRTVAEPEDARLMAELGHAVYGVVAEAEVPTFALVNGSALGGGFELALACQYRTVAQQAKNLGLPEAGLGLIPGWGGVYRFPRLVGIEAALKVMVVNPLTNNRLISGAELAEMGGANTLVGTDEDFLTASLEWVAQVLGQQIAPAFPAHVDPHHPANAQVWDQAISRTRRLVSERTHDARPAPGRVLDVVEANRTLSQTESAELEVDALAELMFTPEFQNTVYSFLELLQKRAKNPAGVPDTPAAEIKKVGVVGAGLMAAQLALVFARHLQVPVAMTDMDDARAQAGLDHVAKYLKKDVDRGRLSQQDSDRIRELVTSGTNQQVYADADFVIEAVFEEISVKQDVFQKLEKIVSPDTILATNTSSLSVAEMASVLEHPERLVGFHFFNPVAQMPLIEIVRGPQTSDRVVATAFETAKHLRKTAVLVKDAPAFVVNRLLLLLLGVVVEAFDEGTDPAEADAALDPLGLPMSPFDLLAMVGIPVAQHVAETLHHAFPERFPLSKNVQTLVDHNISSLWSQDEQGKRVIPEETLALLERGDTGPSGPQVLDKVREALAREIRIMLDEGVVAGPQDIDLCVILGAGWPQHLGGITPHLDQTGVSQKVNGKPFGAWDLPGAAVVRE